MIDHYTDRAANERTYLAWVRTSIAVAGFGIAVFRRPGGFAPRLSV